MKYLSKRQILESLNQLAGYNQFFGLTFLAAKRHRLPVGSTEEVSLDAINQSFLRDYYSLDPRSESFFRVFRYNNARQLWLRKDYASKGLQKLNTTSFRDAFIHPRKSKTWGWQEGYVQFLKGTLMGARIPAYHLAVWLFRGENWEEDDSRKTIIDRFWNLFNISEDEKKSLFANAYDSNLTEEESFQNAPVGWKEIVAEFSPPPDVGPDRGGILTYLEMDNVGPIDNLRLEPAQRLNLITGDNGLGKTFLLEIAWWALTGKWAGNPAYPNRKQQSAPRGQIKYQVSGATIGKPQSVSYSAKRGEWPPPRNRATLSGLVVYARVDGSYAVWDPVGRQTKPEEEGILVFDREQVWDGENRRIEGLIRDWTKWQDNPDRFPYDTFLKVLARMSPPEMGPLVPGESVRLPFDTREIPTIKHGYGEVPIIHESAGVRHIITLAYLTVWAWNEHRIAAENFGLKSENRMVILVDEMEVHLHPRWQRIILPALLDVARLLSTTLDLQLLIATHSPLVLASAETIFDTSVDKLFHLSKSSNGKVTFSEVPFLPFGRVDSWLTSDIFDLGHARSSEAERLIDRAIALQKMESPSTDDIREITEELTVALPPEDQFWARWVFFAQKHGVDL